MPSGPVNPVGPHLPRRPFAKKKRDIENSPEVLSLLRDTALGLLEISQAVAFAKALPPQMLGPTGLPPAGKLLLPKTLLRLLRFRKLGIGKAIFLRALQQTFFRSSGSGCGKV